MQVNTAFGAGQGKASDMSVAHDLSGVRSIFAGINEDNIPRSGGINKLDRNPHRTRTGDGHVLAIDKVVSDSPAYKGCSSGFKLGMPADPGDIEQPGDCTISMSRRGFRNRQSGASARAQWFTAIWGRGTAFLICGLFAAEDSHTLRRRVSEGRRIATLQNGNNAARCSPGWILALINCDHFVRFATPPHTHVGTDFSRFFSYPVALNL